MTTHRFVTSILGALAAALVPTSSALADDAAYKHLGAEWWQWVLSIPASTNPLLDATGEHCMVGQRGSTWFLAGTFLGGPTARTCSVPEGTTLFLPVINIVMVDTPGTCGQGPARIPVKDYRAAAAGFIDGARNLSVVVDGQPAGPMHRVQSKVFSATLPEDNLFDPLCPAPGLPAAVYAQVIDDGVYLRLNPLPVGLHTLVIHAENPAEGFTLDVAYTLNVVPPVKPSAK